MNDSYYKKIAIIFITSTVAFVSLNFIISDKDFSESENRVLTKKPKFTVERLFDGRYFKKYEKYKTDQFVGRDLFIGVKATSDLVLGKKKSNDVFYANNGYLIEDFKPSNEDIKNNIDAINTFATKFEDTNIYTTVIPTAINIYDDKLPDLVDSSKQETYINDFYKKLNKNIKTIPLTKKFTKKYSKSLFYRTDHHYTSLSAYITYLEIKKTLNLKEDIKFKPYTVSNSFNGTLSSKSGFRTNLTDSIEIYLPENSDIKISVNYLESQKKSASLYNFEKLNEKDKYGIFLDGNHPIIDINTTVNNNKKLLILKDSYANSLIPFLVHHYNKITVVDPRYYYGDLHKLINDNKFDDTLILYNANTFFSDNSLSSVLNNE